MVEAHISKLHDVPARQRANVRKQAEQIRYCLIQAREYFNAARAVTLATKPLLLYYSIMSLALAEILLKHDGMSSLDKARANHRHHGLDLRVSQLAKATDSLELAAHSYSAAPLMVSSVRRGTFELWHQSAREMPLGGRITHHYEGGGVSTGTGVILNAADTRLPLLPEHGITLLDAYRALPGMASFLGTQSIVPLIVRAKLECAHAIAPGTQTLKLVIHPGNDEVLALFFDNLKFAAEAVNRLQIVEVPSGVIIQWTQDPIIGGLHVHFPVGSMWTVEEARISPIEAPLNEFGYLYLTLFIIGNFARYFPDCWMADVEQASALALSVEELVSVAEKRMALLTLSEMTRSYHVAAA